MLFYAVGVFAWGCQIYFSDGTSVQLEFDDQTNEFVYGTVFDWNDEPIGEVSWADPQACFTAP